LFESTRLVPSPIIYSKGQSLLKQATNLVLISRSFLEHSLIKTITPATVALAALTDARIATRDDGTVEDFQIPANSIFTFRQQEVLGCLVVVP
jgi:hypothetical protein